MKYDIILTENLVKLDLFKDFWNVQQSCRKSYYDLKSFTERLNTLIILGNNRTKSEIKKIKQDLEKIRTESYIILKDFENSGNQRIDNSSNKLKEVSVDIINNIEAVDEKYFINSFKNSIKLKEKMDLMQINIISFLYKESEYSIEQLCKNNNILQSKRIGHINRTLVEVGMNHSCDENRIDTYLIDIDNKEMKRSIKKVIKIPFEVRATNYNEVLNKNKNIYIKSIEFMEEVLELKAIYYNDKLIEKRNNQQHFFNIILTIATVVSTIVSILSLIYK